MSIEQVIAPDMDSALRIYAEARRFMKESGNADQWGDNRPAPSTVFDDIAAKRLYKVVDNGTIYAIFCFFVGDEPTYAKIDDGNWRGTTPCGVIHRVAVSDTARGKGVSRHIFDFCASLSPYLRIDTHKKIIKRHLKILIIIYSSQN